jgi:MFS superfamily sulfate permease-like transporter
MDFQKTEPAYALVHIGNLLDNIKWQVSFAGMSQWGVFAKYVVMFALVGSLESLLTLKAIDLRDPYQRKSDPNKDLMAVGMGNVVSAVLGGLPMIAEVARSSANVNSGAKTRWANFFHGFFILAFVVLGVHLIELIPNTALAAMLIAVGIKLAHPKEFIHTFKIGKEQLAIFLVTIFFTLYEDLLVGIAAGILLKFIIHIFHGAPIASLFKAHTSISFEGNDYRVDIGQSALFSNFLGIKDQLNSIPPGFRVTINLAATKVVDHSVMESLHHFEQDYARKGGAVFIVGLDNHKPLSDHAFAARKKTNHAL